MAEAPDFSKQSIVAASEPLAVSEREVKFQEVDAAGTIYYAKTFEYFGDVYLDLLTSAGLDVPRMLAERALAAPIIHAEADYIAPLVFGDRVRVELVLAHLGATSTRYGYRVIKTNGAVAAIGHTQHVWVDGQSFKPVPVPEPLRRYLSGRPGVTLA